MIHVWFGGNHGVLDSLKKEPNKICQKTFKIKGNCVTILDDFFNLNNLARMPAKFTSQTTEKE